MGYALEQEYRRSRIHPQKFALWASMAAIIMMFAAFTSAYIVRQSAGNWLEFNIPAVFFLSTVVMITSSITLHRSFRSYKSGKEKTYKLMLTCSLILGVLFIILQYQGWMQLFSMGVELKGNPSGSFFYVISGMHAAHVLGGISAIVVAVAHAFGLPFYVSVTRIHRFDLVVNYWHFVDALWIYLLLFLYLQ